MPQAREPRAKGRGTDLAGWFWITWWIAAYCVVQVIRDLMRRDFLMAGVGIVILVLLVLSPERTHAMVTDITQRLGR